MMRLFIGLGLPKDAKESLWNISAGLCPGGRWTDRGNYHLTLAFLGAREEAQVPKLRQLMAQAAAGCAPFSLTVHGLRFFGKRGNALLYAALAPSEPLSALSDALRRLLRAAAEDFDDKPLLPHITLARKANLTGADLDRPIPPVSFTADRVTLFHSTRVGGELRYLPIGEAGFPAGGK